MTRSEATLAILTNFPDFSIENINYIAEGFDNVAFEVNTEYIFRFTKNNLPSGFGGSLKIEHCLLPVLQKHLSTTIPQFTYYGTQANDLPFVGYKKIPGTELSKELLTSLTPKETENVFKTIATFFQQLHDYPTSIATNCGVQFTHFKQYYTHDGEKIKTTVLPLLTPKEQQQVQRWLHDYLADETNFEYTPSLIHADLWLSHIYLNKDTKKVAGIIDFSDMTIGDPDYDYMQICQEYGNKAYEYFEKFIPQFNSERVKLKTEFFKKWNVVQDLIIFINRHDEENIQSALMHLKKNLGH